MIQPRPIFGLLIRLGSTVVFATMFMLIKVGAEQGIAVPEIMFWRQAPTVPLILAWLLITKGLGRLRTERLRAHAGRSVVGMTNMAMTFTAATLLPLSEATTLGFTTPLFAVFLSAFYLKQHVGKWRWLSVALGFLGVVIIARPGGEAISPLGATLALSAGFLVAVINYQLRDLGRTEEPIRTVFWFGFFGTLLATPGWLLTMQAHTMTEWAILAGLGITGVVGQMLLAASLRYGAVVSVLVIDYVSLIWATFYGWWIWQRLPHSSLWLGAPAIIAAGIIIAWREHKLHKTAPAVIEV